MSTFCVIILYSATAAAALAATTATVAVARDNTIENRHFAKSEQNPWKHLRKVMKREIQKVKKKNVTNK